MGGGSGGLGGEVEGPGLGGHGFGEEWGEGLRAGKMYILV